MKLATLKREIEKNLNITIDFRSDKYLLNSYGLSPLIDYSKCEDILKEAISILNLKNRVLISMLMSNVRINTLKFELERLIDLNK